jgi:serine/threonine-protein kinase
MSEPHDPHRTVDVPSAPADPLDAGLAAGFGKAEPARSNLDPSQRLVLLKEAEGESAHVVKPKSDAMPPPEQTGDRYQLQGGIARGGMGAVLRGRDVDLGRDLAIKVLLEKHADNPAVAQRFIEEAQIGGQLQHPGVVPVYDVGRFGQRPFFTMKLVKGHTLAALLGERAEAAADLPRFLDIALKVAQTLAYAHAQGVIHRDLKPANIMVGAFGEVQVMDWGLAKVLTEGGVADEEPASRQHHDEGTQIRTARSTGSAGSFGADTEAGSLLGTPAYMPPEQANGDVATLDRRVDVFGLGAILCEILTGKPPYVGRSSEEVRRKAANGAQADALERLDACGADAELVALTKQCLSPEAMDRPKDAQSVAEGLAGYLNGVQERLHQAELAEAEARAKAVEEARRRRLTLALAVTVLLALTLGGGSWLWWKSDRDARRARVTSEVNEALNQVTLLRQQAQAATAGSAALYAQAREQVQRALALVENGPVEAALNDQVQRLKADLDDEEKDRALVAAVDEARLAQAETRSENRFSVELAVPKLREAFAAYGLPAGEGEPEVAAQRIRGRPAAVREAIVAALDLWDVLAGRRDLGVQEPHRQWLRAVLEAADLGAWGRQVRAARALKDPAQRQAALGKLAASADVAKVPAQALTLLAEQLRPSQAADLLRRAQQQHPADFWVNHNLAFALAALRPPKRDEAVRFLTAAAALRPESPGCLLNLGHMLQVNGQVDEALTWYQKALQIDPKYAAAQSNLGAALYAKGQVDEAIACWRKAIALDPRDPKVHSNLGNALEENGQVDEAIACFRKAIVLNPKNAWHHQRLGGILCDLKRDYDGAITCFRKAVELDPKNAEYHFGLGNALKGKGQVEEAIACYRKAIELDPKLAAPHNGLGNALAGKGKVDEAIACWRKAIELDPKDKAAYRNLGMVLAGKGQVDEAIACYRKAIEIDPKDEAAHRNLGSALWNKGQVDQAIACFQKAIEIDPKFAEAHYDLGNALWNKGHIDRAIARYQKAIALNPMLAEAHCNLGHVLAMRGRFAESLASMKRGHELGSKRSNWRYPSRAWVRRAERLAALESKLPAVLRGEIKPKDMAERVGLIGICQAKNLHHAATGLSVAAFAADPKLADDLKAAHRYSAACSAALAAVGQGEVAAKLDDKERTRLRKQALDWLKADLAGYAKRLQSGSRIARRLVTQQMQHWQKDADLAGIRDKAALAKLPTEERAAWEKLWADVAALLKKAEAPAQKEGK